jgi:hypothetical protein
MGLFNFIGDAFGLGDAGSAIDGALSSAGSFIGNNPGLIGAAGSLGAGIYGANAAQNGAQAQADAAAQANQTNKYMYDQTRADYAPWMATGEGALYGLADASGVPRPDGNGGFTAGHGFQTSPGYQFRLNQGLDAIDRRNAAHGMLLSGAEAKGINDYAQGTASDEYGNYTNRLAALAGLGQTANAGAAGAAQNYAAGNSASLNTQGQARASGYTGAANNLIGGVNNAYTYGSLYPSLIARGGGGGYGGNALAGGAYPGGIGGY